jgi:hypothetical protein
VDAEETSRVSTARSIFLARETELRSPSKLSQPGQPRDAKVRAASHRRRTTKAAVAARGRLMATVRAGCRRAESWTTGASEEDTVVS